MKVLITGANGFLARNLRLHLRERSNVEVRVFTRANHLADLRELVSGVDFIFHLAGVNRPPSVDEFMSGNAGLTEAVVAAVDSESQAGGRGIPILFASSTQAANDNPYGVSKRAAEESLQRFAARSGSPVYIFRLPNVFGKGCRQNYNSAVATFCHNVARGLPIQIHDPAAPLTLVYVDDVVASFVALMDCREAAPASARFESVTPQYTTTVGKVAEIITSFRASRDSLLTGRVGVGLVRALYATYVSYLPPESFAYRVPMHGDARGTFVEMLKTPDCGQFSYFTAHPGVTRGGHYHHTKTEKFLVIKGQARFKFRNLDSGETLELLTSGEVAEIVETIPGWAHDITNIGTEEMVVMLWANEVFDRAKPDTYVSPL
jgi:UDP-2-acetamido-2,6-beta-L-arabino-hexul-4-ose reductase